MKGRCINLDCPKTEQGVVFDISDGEDFICPECGHNLHEVSDKENPFIAWLKEHKLLLSIVAAVLVIGGIAALLLLAGDNAPLVTDPIDINVE
ncbi:MAG: hypothetical protein LBR97_02130 [Dysgonamonadaceae bacterium]|jgi:hypothetical protein|nr:hypothetical protein [Dysgonamonadaceae bacterium]